jgi:hypothetical protein
MADTEGTVHPRRHLASALAEVERLTEQLAALEAHRAAELAVWNETLETHAFEKRALIEGRDRITERLVALLPLARAVIRYHFHDSTDRAWVEVEAALDALDPAVRADLEATDDQ